MVTEATLALLRGADSAIQDKMHKRGMAIPGIAPAFVDQLCSKVALPDKQALEMANLTAVVAEKWGLNLRYAPEIALAVSVAGYGLGVLFAIRALDRKERELKQAQQN